jgi:hypothetical protein
MNAYDVLLRLYPREFREEYGEDMAQLHRNQLRDESATRVWARTVLDVALTVPSTRLEAHMSRGAPASVIYIAATVACVVVAALVGTSVGLSVVALAGVLVFGGLAAISWRRSRALGVSEHATHWWKYLLAGGAGLGAAVTAATVSGEAGTEGSWAVFMVVLLTSVGLMATGLVLGVNRVVHHRRHGAPVTGG